MTLFNPSLVRTRGRRLLELALRWLHAWGPTSLILTLVVALLAVLLSGEPASPTAPLLAGAADGQPGGAALRGRGALSRLTITLRPRQRPSSGVAVIYELRGADAALVGSLSTAPQWAGTGGLKPLRYLLVRDAKGLIDTEPDAHAGRVVLQRRATGGVLRVSYLAEDQGLQSRLALRVGPDALSGVGYSFLALPELAAPLAVRLRWQLDATEAQQAATSFAVGTDVVTVARPVDLAHSLFVAGQLHIAEGTFGQRLIALGSPSFDLQEALSFCTKALHGARQLFEPDDSQPHSFVFLPEPGLGTHYDGAALYRSFGIWFDRERSLDVRLRVLVAHEITHRWIGGALRLMKRDGTDATWFSEGFTVHFARSLLLRAGLLSPGQFLEDLQRDLLAQRIAFAEPLGPAAAVPRWTSHASPAYHRGALYAARVHAQLNRAGRGGLPDLLVQLLDRVPSRGFPLPETLWRQTVVEALGPEAGAEYDHLIRQAAAPIEVPDGAFGPCLERVAARQAVFELGFDANSLRPERPVIAGVVVGSAAARAGLRNGMRVLAGAGGVRRAKPERVVDLQVRDASGTTRRVRYHPRRWLDRGTWRVVDSPPCQINGPGTPAPKRPRRGRGWLLP